ncbi:MAG: tetratricopeptide repeat protein [Fimbriimonas sp.]
MKKPLAAVAAVLFLLQAAVQGQFLIPFWTKNYNPGKKAGLITSSLGADQILLQLFGFREFLAGILWVRADGFFDQGNYDAILPIIRLVTILDPKQIDVYATGMWHIGYNFTDEEQRSDRRYIPSALALGKEGSRQNPDTYELFFETGWMWYHKIDDDYDQSVKWFREAQKREDMIPARRNLIASALQRAGKPEEALDVYFDLYDKAAERMKESPDSGERSQRDTLENNADVTLVRMSQRGYFAKKEGRSLAPYDVSPQFDVGFSVKASVIESRVIRFEGTWNVLPIGTRVRVVLKDFDFAGNVPAGMNWDASNDVALDPPRDETFMQEQLFVRNRRFNKKVDLSKDPTMYPFTKDKYLVEFYFNPRSAAPHMQDKFSWDGTGFTDKNFLNTQVRDGQRVMYTKLELTRDQILRRGEWQDKVPVIKTFNYKETTATNSSESVLLDIPSLRANTPQLQRAVPPAGLAPNAMNPGVARGVAPGPKAPPGVGR